MPDAATIERRGTMKFLFLMSHGLRSTLSAIRWGCGRLRKTNVGQLNREQEHLVEEIHRNAKRLSSALRSMFLLAMIEEKTRTIKRQPLFLGALLSSLAQKQFPEFSHRVQLSCPPELQIQTDREILEAVLLDLFAVFTETEPQPLAVFVHAKQHGETVELGLHASLELPVLQALADAREDARANQSIGDIPGLMLSLGRALAERLGGTVEIEKTVFNDEMDGSLGGEEYTIQLALPLALRGER